MRRERNRRSEIEIEHLMKMNPGESRYRSAVDLWLVAVLLAAVLAPLWHGIRLLAAGDQDGLLVVAVLVFSVLPILAACFPCRYILTDRSVITRCGVAGIIENEIEYKTIESVSRSWNPLAAPAWSLKRVKIKCEGGWWKFALISPVNREAFIAELNRRREVEAA